MQCYCRDNFLFQVKCEQYWPDVVGEPKQYGDVIVEITSYSTIRTYDYRMFKITNVSCAAKSMVLFNHWHYKLKLGTNVIMVYLPLCIWLFTKVNSKVNSHI